LAPTLTETLEAYALQLANGEPGADGTTGGVGAVDPEHGAEALVEAAGGDRDALETARNRMAQRLYGNSGNVAAGAALSLLNKALVRIGWVDPYDWRPRLGNRLRKP
jgi:hypothetical protein